MTEQRTFPVDMALFDKPPFRREKFTDRLAFIWMLGRASFSTDLGHLDGPVQALASAWHWQPQEVERFLSHLVKAGLIERQQDAITIRNFSDWCPNASVGGR